jgi:hypothetical protein
MAFYAKRKSKKLKNYKKMEKLFFAKINKIILNREYQTHLSQLISKKKE